jgi:hypothetical protein
MTTWALEVMPRHRKRDIVTKNVLMVRVISVGIQ